jgi:arginine exporter protein ArgO
MWLGILTFLIGHFPEARRPAFKWCFCGGFILGSLSWFGPLAFVLLAKIREWDEAHLHTLSRLLAAVLVAVAFLLVLEKI